MAQTVTYILLLLLQLSYCAAITCPTACQCTIDSATCRDQGLTTFPTNLPTTLQTLDLSRNAITRLDDQLHPFTQLRHLDISKNRLSFVKKDTFMDNKDLKTLILSDNELIVFDPILPGSVTDLDLSRNKIQRLALPHHVVKADLSSNVIVNLTGLVGDKSELVELDLSRTNLTKIPAYAFSKASKLQSLKLNKLVHLYHINYTAFRDLNELKHLEISANPRFTFIHKDLFDSLISLEYLDLNSNNITSFYAIAYEQLQKLKTIDVHGNPLTCNCALRWLQNTTMDLQNGLGTRCSYPDSYRGESLLNIPSDDLLCTPPRILNYTKEPYFKVGSQAVLKCNVEGDPSPMVQWTVPSGKTYTYDDYLRQQWDTRPSKESVLEQLYHRNVRMQKELEVDNYQDDIGPDRVLLLSNGDLFISYVHRSDAGRYKCSVLSPGGNDTVSFQFLLNYVIIKDITVASMIVGFSSAGIFFGFGLLVALLRYIGNKCAERQRKKSRSIRKIIGHLDTYRSNQMDRLKENYGGHVGKMKEHALAQMDKMRESYFSQIARIQEKCATRMDHLRENYNTQMGKIKGYSNHQIEKIRENYNNQMIKIRDYSSVQLEKLRETYKLQHQHLMKILEAMNIDNCRGIVDEEAAKANAVLFETKFTLDNIGDLNLEAIDLDTLDNLNLDNLSTGHNSLCISDDFQTACSDPDGISVSDLHLVVDNGSDQDDSDLQLVTARVHEHRPETHSEYTQTQEEDLAQETDVFVINVDSRMENPPPHLGEMMSSSII